MKKNHCSPISVLLAFFLLIPFLVNAQGSKKQTGGSTTVEQQRQVCSGLSRKEKPMLAVMDFRVQAPGADQAVGGGMSAMLTNALFGTGCFRIVERERMRDIMAEQGLGASGAGNESSFAQMGNMLGAQALVMGTVTEFSEAAGGSRITRNTAIGRVGVATSTAHIGVTIRIVDPTTGELLGSESFNKKRTSSGLATSGLFGSSGSATFFESKAMQDAVEELLLDASAMMSEKYRKDLADAVQETQVTTNPQAVKITPDQCALLRGTPPKIMVIVPEEHVAGIKNDVGANGGFDYSTSERAGQGGRAENGSGILRDLVRRPDPAGETEIIRRFLEFGFEVVDAKTVKSLQAQQNRAANAYEDSEVAAGIGAEFGADVVIVGEAFSEYAREQNNLYSCRARVEVKAIEVSTGRILAAEGLHGSGMDPTEGLAGKTALRNAGGKVADYLLNQLCGKSIRLAQRKPAQRTETSSAPRTSYQPSTTPQRNNQTETASTPSLPDRERVPSTSSQKTSTTTSTYRPSSSASSASGKTAARPSSSTVSTSEITIDGVNFSQTTQIEAFLQKCSGVEKVERRYSFKKAVFTVHHRSSFSSVCASLDGGKSGVLLEKNNEEANAANFSLK